MLQHPWPRTKQWLTRKEIPNSDAVCEKKHLVLTEFNLYCSARMALPRHDLHPCPRHRYIRSTKSKQKQVYMSQQLIRVC
jgi:hypothetical protein